MSVKDIISEKGSDIISVNKNDKLRHAINTLNENNIGAVIVTDDNGDMCGILSERDIIRRALAQESGFRDEKIAKTMTKQVKSVSLDTSIDQVMDIMTNSRIRHIPVLDNGQLKGVVSIGDVVKRKIQEAEQETEALRDYIIAG